MANSYKLRDAIPGVGGKTRIPGGGRTRAPRNVGGLRTSIKRQPTSSEFRDLHRQQIKDSRGRFASGWGFAWQGLEAVGREIDAMDERLHQNLERKVLQLAEDMVNWAKENHPWQNNTGNAERGLQAQVVWSDKDHFTIFLGHGPDVFYGIWLEVRWGGRYAILQPTVEHFMQQGVGGRLVSLT